jgi:hypothetical protein
MNYKVTKFNVAAFNRILLILISDYLLIHDQDIPAYAAYMKRLKKYANVMSNSKKLEYTK